MIDGTAPRYFARLEREGPWWNVTFRDCPGCITLGRGRREALAMAEDALATWCADVPPMRLPKPSAPAAGEVLIAARFHRPPRALDLYGGKPALGRMAARWRHQAGGWR